MAKKARVESMVYLQNYPPETTYFLTEDINSNILRFPPLFYAGNWPKYDYLLESDSPKQMAATKNWNQTENQPQFVLFFQDKDLEKRVDGMKEILPALEFETTIYPGNMDRFIHWLNPINANEKNSYLP